MGSKYSAPWLPNGAAKYGSRLRRDPTFKTTIQWGEETVVFDNGLSRRILFDPLMEPVWIYLSSVQFRSIPNYSGWKWFLRSIQLDALGPPAAALTSKSQVRKAIADIDKHGSAIQQISLPYVSDITVIQNAIEDLQNRVSVNALIVDLLKSPKHIDVKYQWFVRGQFLFFWGLEFGFNQWDLLARTCNATGLFEQCDSDRVRGTCKDLRAEELRFVSLEF